MSIITNIAHPLGGADNVTAQEIVQGLTARYRYRQRDANKQPLDITGWDLSVSSEWALASVNGSVVSRLVVSPSLGPGPQLVHTPETLQAGIFEIYWPAGAFTGTVALGETKAVPVCVSYVKIANTDTPPIIRGNRWLTIYRRGDDA